MYIEKPDPRDGVGSYLYTEAFVGSWTVDGQRSWQWQRAADEIRTGALHAIAVGAIGEARCGTTRRWPAGPAASSSSSGSIG